MNDGRRSRLITLALLLSGCAAAGGSLGTLTDAGMIRGSAMSREACASVPAAAWVVIEEEGDWKS